MASDSGRYKLEEMNTFTHVPPGFRFHPTDEELVDYYLRKKISSRRIDLDVIKDVDLYKIEPWDLQELCRIETEEQNEWYFFSHKDKKYPTGTRTNRATAAGFWKATGRDRAIYSKLDLIGLRKTLVFYKGRAPNGQKSDWIMHEYRLETDENGTPQEEEWVVCRVFKKRIATVRKMSDHESSCWYDDPISFMPELESPKHNSHANMPYHYHHLPYSCKKEIDQLQYQIPHDQFLQFPLLETTPKLGCNSMAAACGLDINHGTSLHFPSFTHDEHLLQQPHEQSLQPFYLYNSIDLASVNQVTDWRVFHKFVASQLSHEDAIAKEDNNYSSNAATVFHGADQHSSLLPQHLINKEETLPDQNALTSTSSCQIELWK